MLRRLAIGDTLLITVACVVILISSRPSGQPRQTFQVRGVDGTVRAYSLPLGDPQLGELKHEFGVSAVQLPGANLAVAKWTRDLAAFYSQNCPVEGQPPQIREQAGSVVRVSFDDSTSQPAATLAPSTRGYWVGVQEKMQRSIEVAEQQLADRRKSPAVVFGDVIEPRSSYSMHLLALAIGLIVSVFYAMWRDHHQPIRLERAGPHGELVRLPIVTPGQPALMSHLVIPPEWIRLRQPLRVIARRTSLLAIVAWAFICVVF